MPVYENCQNNVVTSSPDTKVIEVVQTMVEKNVGCIVITAKQMPVGIVTDRNIILRVVAKKKDPKKLAVREIMKKDPVVIEGGKGAV